MPVNTTHKEYDFYRPIWKRNRDGIAGQDKVKAEKNLYLSKPSGMEQTEYDGYLSRARYTNFSKRTLNAASGQIMRKPPVFPDSLDDDADNITLSGQSLLSFASDILDEVTTVYRAGVLVDYSEDNSRPYLKHYPAESIINWGTDTIAGNEKLSFIVCKVCENVSKDPFKAEDKDVYIVYRLIDGVYTVQRWIESEKTKGEFVQDGEDIVPIMDNKPLDYIPFYFVTPQGIKVELDQAPLTDFIDVNYGHYQNSADYENMLHWTGCKTAIITGWDSAKPFPVGGAAVLNDGGQATFLEASSDSGLATEMRHKEEQMAILGSAIMSGKGRYVASAEAASITSDGENAVTADIANAMSDAFSRILTTYANWKGIQEDQVVKFNTDFDQSEMLSTDAINWMSMMQSGAISFDTYFALMERKELYPKGWTMEDEIEAIDETMQKIVKRREPEPKDDEGFDASAPVSKPQPAQFE
jgi:Domain of unknown function (DUF4055)